jgi:hypothetical protein
VTIERARWPALGLAVLGWAFLSAYYGYYSNDAGPVPPPMVRSFQRGVYGAEQWLAIVAVLGFARRHLVHDNAARRYLTAAIFPLYILHQTVIVVVAHSLKPAHLEPGVEGALLVLVTSSACLLGFEVIRRVRILRPLFGLPAGAASPPTAISAADPRAASTIAVSFFAALTAAATPVVDADLAALAARATTSNDAKAKPPISRRHLAPRPASSVDWTSRVVRPVPCDVQ